MKKVGYLSLIVLGSLFIVVSIFGYFKASGTREWQHVKGKCMSVVIKQKFKLFTGGRKGRPAKKTYAAWISYGYMVDGEYYRSDTYEINYLGFRDGLTGSRSYLEEVLNVRKKYPVGSPVDVFYDPEDPASAVLARGYRGYMPTYLIVSLLAIGYGLYGLVRD